MNRRDFLRSLPFMAALPFVGRLPEAKPSRAMGGYVKSGQTFIIGNSEPYFFVPDTEGRILPRLYTSFDDGDVWVSDNYGGAWTKVESGATWESKEPS